ncbi:MAG: CDP-alcohol phosphatidyltransferase family protein [Burkholderiales bacterium]|jgi:phosphatidylglycerophosphate synthase|nr:CDP-alcohol phosphatidyltransferase family protein [Burkholderiales bacterium]
MRALRHLPLALTALRALLAPVMVLLAVAGPSRAAFGVCLVVAFLSDVFDGILARRLGIATPKLRRLDSIADSLFYVAALFAAWHLQREALLEHRAALILLVVLEISRYAFDLRKFGREASYHMWSSKLWGLALFAGFFSLLALGRSGWPVTAAVWLGIVADLEGLAISVVLTRWANDVPSIVHACRLRDSGRG